MDRQVDALGLHGVCPLDDRSRLESELGDDGHLGIGALAEVMLPPERRRDIRRAAVGVDVAVALGMAGDMQPGEASLVKEARLQKLHRAVEVALRLRYATGQQQRLRHARFALIPRNPVAQRGLVRDDACREMRHHPKAVGGQALGRRDHVLDGRAVDMGDIDPGALGQQGAEILDLLRRPRHHLDRVVLEKALDRTAPRHRVGFSLEIQQRHNRSPYVTRRQAHPSFAIRALILSASYSASIRAASAAATSC